MGTAPSGTYSLCLVAGVDRVSVEVNGMAGRAGRVRVLAALGAAIALVLPVRADAADDELVITGSRNAYTDIRVAETMFLQPQFVQVAGTSRVLAASIELLGGHRPPLHFAVLSAPQFSDRVEMFPGGIQMNPGVYRIRMITDRRATVTIGVDRGGRTVRPDKRMNVRVSYAEKPVPPGRSNQSVRVRNAVPAGFGALLGFKATGQAYEDRYACATNDERCPRGVITPPAPIPNVDPGFRPSQPDGQALMPVEKSRDSRAVLIGVQGVRTSAGMLRGLVVAYDN